MNKRKPRTKIAKGDVIGVPLASGDLGLVVWYEEVLVFGRNAILLVTFLKCRPENADCLDLTAAMRSVVGVGIFGCSSINRRIWKVLGRIEVGDFEFPERIAAPRAGNLVGCSVYSQPVLVTFLNAVHGFTEWDVYHNPKELDHLLLEGVGLPPAAWLKSSKKR